MRPQHALRMTFLFTHSVRTSQTWEEAVGQAMAGKYDTCSFERCDCMHLGQFLCYQIILNLVPFFFQKLEVEQNTMEVHAGNKSRKFCTESAAHRKHIDNKRKRQHRSEAKSRERVEACQTTRMKPLTSYFVSQTHSMPTLRTTRPSNRKCSGRRCPSRHQWGVGCSYERCTTR
jgi:hypothetical protein